MNLQLALASAMAVVGVAVTLAGPAYADATDDQFLSELRAGGLTYQDPDRAIVAGKSVCQLVNEGKTDTEIVRELQNRNPGFTQYAAAEFTTLAAAAYCPKYLTGEGRGPKPGSGG
ncbi:DUF732 domain-containing protein [Mycobacterium riyadhense]|uniref:DUF732 domain-containing protein n=1 Tax=Mycobacterium riyadhense TaxID=486698 RepID=A0A1X2DGC0_9MYCO|nr:DUF732 domain-containing protein [Mycobacterium riyadhense]MCV7146350.1 DUF732 domain-containing protein [Mycobacterium riyadhense]ORW87192.1 hypothetical protein AWC22_09510 [Mycobacterium riyadhense]VTO94733.1 hypothetical protein BIN_B_00206 [Mycobacterium riyadhense]